MNFKDVEKMEDFKKIVLPHLFANKYPKRWIRSDFFPTNTKLEMSFMGTDSRYNENKSDEMVDYLIKHMNPNSWLSIIIHIYRTYPHHLYRYFGGVLLVNAGLDMKAFTEEGTIFGYEIKATWSLFHYEAGLIEVHLGAGISSAAKIEDGTVDARFLGCGTKFGKRIGFTIFDNELSIDVPTILEKIWLWEKGQEKSSTIKDSDHKEINMTEMVAYSLKHQEQPGKMRRRLLTHLVQSVLYPSLFSSYWEGTIEVNAGLDILDMKAFTGKGKIFGYEIKATFTLLHYNPGLIEVHLGAGISCAAKVNDGTVDARFLGCGTKVGKRIGITFFDNELSIDVPTIVEEIWLWLVFFFK